MTTTTLRSIVTRTVLAFAVAASALGCDPEATEPALLQAAELDTVDAWADERYAYRLVELDGERRLIAEAEREGLRLVVVAETDGMPLAVATLEEGRLLRLDVDALLVESREDAAPEASDPTSEAVLDRVLHEPALASFRYGLTSAPRTQELRIGSCLGCIWDILMVPELSSLSCELCVNY